MSVQQNGFNFSLKTLLIGKPLATKDLPHQTISKKIGLAVFASATLSSTAYATEEILLILALAGAGAATLSLSLPIAGAIAVLLAIVTLSYRQTIFAYPNGGGDYIVARDNLGELPAQIAGAALLTDYILTVAVSISSGVAQITSAFPALHDLRVEIALGMIVSMTIVNLRGVKESGFIFSIPPYFFPVMMVLTLGVGMYRYFSGTLPAITDIEAEAGQTIQILGLFLILRAFSSGCTALTGIEAISNGITAFKDPRSKNAATTLMWMSGILITLFLGITFLANQIHGIPNEHETIISQLARSVYGRESILYLLTLAGTTIILIMAANTSFADFPRLAALHAGDGFLPRQLTYKGSRLVFSWGIVILALVSSLLIVLFQASVTALIPLYAIGVFISFTMSQVGMVVRWRKIGRLGPDDVVETKGSRLQHDPRWRRKIAVNALGALVTFGVMVVQAVTKFMQGAWIVVLLIPSLVWIFFRIHHHYDAVRRQLSVSLRSMHVSTD